MSTLTDESVWNSATLAPYADTDTVKAAREVQDIAQGIVEQVDANPANARTDFNTQRHNLDDALRRTKAAHYHEYQTPQQDLFTFGEQDAPEAKAKCDALHEALSLAETYADTATAYAIANLEG